MSTLTDWLNQPVASTEPDEDESVTETEAIESEATESVAGQHVETEPESEKNDWDDINPTPALKQSVRNEVWNPDLTQAEMFERYMELHPDANLDAVDIALDELIEELIPKEPEEPEAEPKFGDYTGRWVRLGRKADSGHEVYVDKDGVDVYTGEHHELTLEQKAQFLDMEKESRLFDMNRVAAQAKYDHTAPQTERKYDYDGLVVSEAYCLWLGARKAEKSLFALRKAMHDACGKDWFNHKNMLGPVKVLYFDTENDKADVDERYREIITEFSESEQALIKKNLTIELGKEWKRQGHDIEFNNTEVWETLQRTSKGVRIVYLDCWYQLQSIKASDNEKQKKALEMFEKYFPNTTLFLLHHTGRESQESLLRKNPPWLRVLGAERWSNKSSGGNVLTKKADLIICQEKDVERDEEGVENDSYIDFQAYSRSGPGSILLSFEPVFGEEIDGQVHEYKYRRKMVVKLSSLAGKAANKLHDKGPWDSKYDLAKEVGMVGGKQYKAIDELIVKGFIVHDNGKFFLNETGYAEAIHISTENPVAVKSAAAILDDLLLKPDGTPNDGVLFELIEAKAKADGIDLESIRRAKRRRKIQTREVDGKAIWYVPGKTPSKATVNFNSK